MTTERPCRAKDPSACPYHGAKLRQSTAEQSADFDAYIVARDELSRSATQPKLSELKDLSVAYSDWHYTILGAGGDPHEWIKSYSALLAQNEIGIPSQWYFTTGAALNKFAGKLSDPRNAFQHDLNVLTFTTNGLDAGRLARFRLLADDKWFTDVIDNMRR